MSLKQSPSLCTENVRVATSNPGKTLKSVCIKHQMNVNGTMSPSNAMRIRFLIVYCVHVYVDDFVFETNILNRCSRNQSFAFLTILYANAQNVLFRMH